MPVFPKHQLHEDRPEGWSRGRNSHARSPRASFPPISDGVPVSDLLLKAQSKLKFRSLSVPLLSLLAFCEPTASF